jgi:hypothetical protein
MEQLIMWSSRAASAVRLQGGRRAYEHLTVHNWALHSHSIRIIIIYADRRPRSIGTFCELQ